MEDVKAKQSKGNLQAVVRTSVKKSKSKREKKMEQEICGYVL